MKQTLLLEQAHSFVMMTNHVLYVHYQEETRNVSTFEALFLMYQPVSALIEMFAILIPHFDFSFNSYFESAIVTALFWNSAFFKTWHPHVDYLFFNRLSCFSLC